jgi:hypothetical protein
MTVLELEKDDLLALSDAELEQLIGRLSEAELATNGASVSEVRFSGSITAPDGGVDVRVNVADPQFTSAFVQKPNTIFQAKKHTMPAGAIVSEMAPKSSLSETIDQQARIGGGYVIVSLADDCTENPMLSDRINAMNAAMGDHPNRDDIHLDFFDRFKLHQWLRQHPGIMLWARQVIGRPLSGWQPHQRWSHVPAEDTDELITTNGVSVVLPTIQHQKLTIAQAIDPTRELIRASRKAIRITGLSGVGKTRFVQALFEEEIGENALDRTSVIYADTGADPVPSARQMIDQLIQDGRSVTVVIDNCPPALHSDLASRVSNAANHLKLITVEYDIRDDKPLTTDVVQIETHGPEIAEVLVKRRYPELSDANARKIAEFANGNTRVALALADRVEADESLANLSDANLFDRLFHQRHEEDGRLREHAEVLSLVYSFSAQPDEGAPDELAILAQFTGVTADNLFRSAQTLLDRQIAQKRSQWRAILPQAIANRLASSGLAKVRIATLRSIFENPANTRLLKSFAHRIGLLHENPAAQEIVGAWLQPGGLLTPVTAINEANSQILSYVAPVCPNLLLDRIEAELTAEAFGGFEERFDNRRTTILSMLVSLAYESETFIRCLNLLVLIARAEDPDSNYDSVRDKIVQFFQPYLSGSHATLEQRAAMVRSHISSDDSIERAIGFSMLSKALGGPSWTGAGMGDFGARPRDFGYQPNHQQLVDWRHQFIDIAVEAGLDQDMERSSSARSVLADKFRSLWRQDAVRQKLADAATQLNERRAWSEGWKAVQSTLYFGNRRLAKEPELQFGIDELVALQNSLRPTDLISNINAYLFGRSIDLWSLDPDFDHDDTSKYEAARSRIAATVTDFGREFSSSKTHIGELGDQLFSANSMAYGEAFGRGLALGSADARATWGELVAGLRGYGEMNFNCSVLSGFLDQVAEANDYALAQEILDECAGDPQLRTVIVQLHQNRNFTETDLDRSMTVLDDPNVSGWVHGDLLWRSEYAHLPSAKLVQLASTLLEKPNGPNLLLDALGMRLHNAGGADDGLGNDLRRLGLEAATMQIQRDRDGSDMVDHHLAEVLKACLAHGGHDAEKTNWLDALFAAIDASYGSGSGYEGAIAATVAAMPDGFLDRVFQGNEDQRRYRKRQLEHVSHRRSVLGDIAIERLIAWNQAQRDPQVWQILTRGFSAFIPSGEDNRVKLSDGCVQFLEASPNPIDVLNGYAEQITPNGWSGSRADTMEQNTDALRVLLEHEDQAIHDATRQVIARARTWIAAERQREKKDDEAREQSFE